MAVNIIFWSIIVLCIVGLVVFHERVGINVKNISIGEVLIILTLVITTINLVITRKSIVRETKIKIIELRKNSMNLALSGGDSASYELLKEYSKEDIFNLKKFIDDQIKQIDDYYFRFRGQVEHKGNREKYLNLDESTSKSFRSYAEEVFHPIYTRGMAVYSLLDNYTNLDKNTQTEIKNYLIRMQEIDPGVSMKSVAKDVYNKIILLEKGQASKNVTEGTEQEDSRVRP